MVQRGGSTEANHDLSEKVGDEGRHNDEWRTVVPWAPSAAQNTPPRPSATARHRSASGLRATGGRNRTEVSATRVRIERWRAFAFKSRRARHQQQERATKHPLQNQQSTTQSATRTIGAPPPGVLPRKRSPQLRPRRPHPARRLRAPRRVVPPPAGEGEAELAGVVRIRIRIHGRIGGSG